MQEHYKSHRFLEEWPFAIMKVSLRAEQDHRRIKFRVSAMLGFKSFRNARAVLAGIELIQKLKKGQFGVPFTFGRSSRDIWRRVLTA